jgi:ligand-binding SRPBCC domain-containing protein
VSKRNFFTDRQTKSPYKIWEHTHTFRKVNGGVLMNDILKYQMPLGFIGELAHMFLVRRKIDKIFSYRKKVLENLFNKNGINNN